ncbi:ABC transporter ATP-binding protein [Agrobacterium tumefaciens]|uniref:sn-glycerol-3-phosphate ABC transporter ATP-binding protein UgpC n=1 Tax=Agrobacterium tumefaciens TaxID=358 RepID=A0A4D7Z6L6_AGRTU|nr:sn-glycerol-3-phosphate ABC transporter ATP-binding protein UgpC [Agrobacterium tumefaciens]QCL97710.1 sn-glycerol-3-phosphate ABC transporter ATP-binding protein UgpC [Agrobacterium tumefaciens]
MGAVSLKNVSKSFGAVEIIKNVSVDIDEGEFCVLIGPSGSGKSTLLRIIAGLEPASDGSVHIGGRDVTDLPPKQRDIAMVFQSYALYPQMTVRENMSFALRLARRPKDEILQKTNEVAQILGLESLLDRLPKELSGGQRQRVAMGRAIVRNPSVFLFDEPLSNLDAKLRNQVRGEIRDLHRRWKTTSVYVTHDQVEAMTMGQKIVVLRDGRVEQAGTPLELYDSPKSLFVAGFIGTPAINVVNAELKANQSSALLAGGQIKVPVLGKYGDMAPETVFLGIRPEHFEFVSADTLGAIPGTVHAVETTGSDTVVICDTPVGQIFAASKNRTNLKIGETVALKADGEKALLFDTQSQLRLSPVH